ncbi:hypothetical protein C5167_030850 [Papaver somniferum]|nr:hypothetical protein C5167_030850 [Papaver somniferum]
MFFMVRNQRTLKKHHDIGYHFKAACRQTGCLLVGQFYFHNNPKNFADLGRGVLGCRGLHFSFRARQGGLNIGYGCDDLYSELWRACAGPLVDVPKISERVYYFPQGSMEQYA